MYDADYMKTWRKKNPDYNKKWLKRNPEYHKKYNRKYHLIIKMKVINHYTNNNPKCQCPKCNITEIRFLTVDHINGGGRNHTRKILKTNGGITLWRWIINNGFPTGFQILCYNCNCSKGSNRSCGHYG